MDADELARCVGGELSGDAGVIARRIVTDSRAVIRAGDAFLGLIGPHFDGGTFASEVLAQGAGVAIVATDTGVRHVSGTAVIRVEKPLEALRALAERNRALLQGTVIGITGSSGKTLVKDMLATMLAPVRSVWASPMSWNSQVGVPLALLRADPSAEVVLIECGISEVGEMARHASLVRPDLGVFVNVGDGHVEGLGERETTAGEMALLFSSAERVFVPSDQRLARAALGTVAVPVPTPVGFLETDAALAGAVALDLGLDASAVAAGLVGWRPPSMRLEISTTARGIVLVNDSSTSDPESVEAALRVLMQEPTGRAIAVIGGMARIGVAREDDARQVAQKLVEYRVDHLIAVGPGGVELARAARKAGMSSVEEVAGVPEAARRLQVLVQSGDRVLLKGSPPDRLERRTAEFFTALPPAVLTVDLDAIVGNFQRIRRVASPAAVMPVVKAFGYGVDSVRLALALQHAGAEHFAVAYPDEGVVLREHGVVRPILVQNVLHTEAEKLFAYGLSAQVIGLEQLELLEAEASRRQCALRVHLKVDTGMGRAGCAPEHALSLAQRVTHSEWLDLDGVMTHFASADDPASDDFTRSQIACFDAVLRRLEHGGVHARWVHAANSAGIARFPEAHYSMVRVGLALFGYSAAVAEVSPSQQEALRLVTRVVSVKRVGPGESVGYGRTFVTGDRARRIAVVALGYGDGYPWALSNRGRMRVGDCLCPVVGRVCMDVTLLDVTDAGSVNAGDRVVVFGPGVNDPSLIELASAAGTIPYELLTRLSPRVRRVFESSV